MAARGQESKTIVLNKIQETFPEAFIYGKELRIPIKENGEEVQIKVTLTCAKDNVSHDGESATPTVATKSTTSAVSADVDLPWGERLTEPTDEEKENVSKLISSLF